MGLSLDDITNKLMGTGSTKDLMPLLLLYLLGNMESKNQTTTTPNEAIDKIKDNGSGWQKLLTDTMNGTTSNSALTQARTNVQNNVNTPATPPAVYNPDVSTYQTNPQITSALTSAALKTPTTATQPTRYNPYVNSSGQSTGYGQLDPNLLSIMKNSANGQTANSGQTTQMNNQLTNMMNNRFGTRDMNTGVLTPAGKQASVTPSLTSGTTPGMSKVAFEGFTNEAANAKPYNTWTFDEWTQYAKTGVPPKA